MTSDRGSLAMADAFGAALGSNEETRQTVRRHAAGDSRGAAIVEASAISMQTHEVAAVGELGKLIEAMGRGNERALEDLYDATVGKLHALAAAILRSTEDAEEVVCATYAYAWANVPRYDAGRATVLGWLLMLCRSRALDRLRQRRAEAALVDAAELQETDTDGEQPDDILFLMQQRSRIYAALARLTPEKRRLISMTFLRGLSHQEIAHVTGMPLGTVKSHVRRALAQLREVMEGA